MLIDKPQPEKHWIQVLKHVVANLRGEARDKTPFDKIISTLDRAEKTMQRKEPTTLELQKFNQLFERNPVEAVQFARERRFAIDPGVLSDEHERLDSGTSGQLIRAALGGSEIERKSMLTKQARFLLENDQTVEDYVREGSKKASQDGWLKGLLSLEEQAKAHGLPQLAREVAHQYRATSARLKAEEAEFKNAYRDAGGTELSNAMVRDGQAAEYSLRGKYGLHDGPGKPEVQKLFQAELDAARSAIAAKYQPHVEKLQAEVKADLATKRAKETQRAQPPEPATPERIAEFRAKHDAKFDPYAAPPPPPPEAA